MNPLTTTLRQSLPLSTSKSFVRHESSARRLTKRLRLHPHPSMTITGDTPTTSHIIYNPPAAAPTPLITPWIFLPRSDPRRGLMKELGPVEERKHLPPPLARPYQKSYHLTAEDFKKIKELREADPKTYSVNRLAKDFKCSELLVKMIVRGTKERWDEVQAEFDKVKSRWGERKTIAREEREKRRSGWGGADGL